MFTVTCWELEPHIFVSDSVSPGKSHHCNYIKHHSGRNILGRFCFLGGIDAQNTAAFPVNLEEIIIWCKANSKTINIAFGKQNICSISICMLGT